MLFRRDNGCFLNEKYIKFDPKMTKNTKFSKFQCFYAIFVKFSTDFVDWNVEKTQQGTNLLSSSLFRRDLGRKISRWSAGVLFLIFDGHRVSSFQSICRIYIFSIAEHFDREHSRDWIPYLL